ncbi:hypothetical protein MM239_00205 [Belliella sp. DSM 111904]|uniref:Long-chain fatty acid transport protein n=1 Tax=Belliella filtrata TaxID=2923435 RepID=A0ABS9UVL3_9BACT|nr:hypothetical protein [Belliella filtrata]MCH7407800.1 hypothetical protein [Belliella filtrata]
MSIKNRLRLLGTIGVFFIFSNAFSQTSASTYSALGLGEFSYGGLTHNQAMGGLGVSYGTGYAINNVNPALSTRNTAFNFQAALNYRSIEASSSTENESLSSGGLSYLAMSLPFKPNKFTMGMGINQLSSVNYNIIVNSDVTNSNLNAINQIRGDGGITEGYISAGYVLAKNLSIGLHGSYLFGSTIRTNQLTLRDTASAVVGATSEYYERLTVSDVSFKAGAHYFFRSGKQSNIHFGAFYHSFGDIKGKQFAKVADLGEASDPDSPGDIISNNDPGTIFLPNRMGYGVSFEKINKFVVGLEAQYQDFSQYRNFSGEFGELGESFKIGLGAQFTPDVFSMDNIFKRGTYRAGVEYIQTPYVVNQSQITDIGINFGGSIPVNSLSLVNVALKVGTRGSTGDGLIRENYFNVSFGFSLNDNTWFYKRTFE